MELAEYVVKALAWTLVIGTGLYGLRLGLVQIEVTIRRRHRGRT